MPRLDLALAGILTMLGTVAAILDGRGGWGSVALIVSSLLLTAPLAWRRRHAVAVLLVGMAALSGSALLTEAPESAPTLLAILVAVYSVGAHSELPTALGSAAVAACAIAVAIATDPSDSLSNVPPTLLLFVAAPLLAGVVARRREAATLALSSRAAALEAERDETAREAAAQERARIARELHDVVSHGMSMIAVQADAAEAALETDPELAERPVAAVKEAARVSMADMRRMLGLLRESEREAGENAHGIGDIPELVARVEAAGVPVAMATRGEPRPFAPEVELTAYRVVQEALTNTVKHTTGARAEVVVEFAADRLTLLVRDDGRPRDAESSGGSGLSGMRQRVELLGGQLEAAPRADGGFQVRAILPGAARS